jgi:hypothetical protein
MIPHDLKIITTLLPWAGLAAAAQTMILYSRLLCRLCNKPCLGSAGDNELLTVTQLSPGRQSTVTCLIIPTIITTAIIMITQAAVPGDVTLTRIWTWIPSNFLPALSCGCLGLVQQNLNCLRGLGLSGSGFTASEALAAGLLPLRLRLPVAHLKPWYSMIS